MERIEFVIPMTVERKSKARLQAVASILEFPDEKQPDLLYFSGILVSSGENLNNAYFMPSELVKAEASVSNKAVDKEHEEQTVIGHIYDRAFVDKEGKAIDIKELADVDSSEVDKDEMDIAIAGIIYKSRFPEEAKEVKNGEWALSMEAYFEDYDVKIGDMLIPSKEAEALGLTASSVGKEAKVVQEDKAIAEGPVTRVLRNIIFAGCGIVKNPANPDSVFWDTANLKDIEDDGEVITIEMPETSEEAKVEKEKIEDARIIVAPDTGLSGPDGVRQDTVSQCIFFKRFEGMDDGDNPVGDWCNLYKVVCTSSMREQSDPDCLYHKNFMGELTSAVEAALNELEDKDDKEAREATLQTFKDNLIEVLNNAAKKCGEDKSKKSTKKKKKY